MIGTEEACVETEAENERKMTEKLRGGRKRHGGREKGEAERERGIERERLEGRNRDRRRERMGSRERGREEEGTREKREEKEKGRGQCRRSQPKVSSVISPTTRMYQAVHAGQDSYQRCSC